MVYVGWRKLYKFFDVFKIKNLYTQIEYNKANKNMYTANDPMQSYTHYGQEFAHPFGAWFDEILMITHYEKNKFFIQGKIVSAFQQPFHQCIQTYSLD